MGASYKVGAGGVCVVFRDGSTAQYAAFSTVTFDRSPPLKIDGRLFRVRANGQPAIESPEQPALETK